MKKGKGTKANKINHKGKKRTGKMGLKFLKK